VDRSRTLCSQEGGHRERAGGAGIRQGFPSLGRPATRHSRGEIDVLPTERGQVGENFVGDLLERAQGDDRAVQISGAPQDDRRDEKVQAGGAMLLVFVSAVADFPSRSC
jgi:hypothetical protein